MFWRKAPNVHGGYEGYEAPRHHPMLRMFILDMFTLRSFVGKHIATERRSFQNQAIGKEIDI